jgi:sulfite reductase alpha subunit-like flavoprotein
VSTSKKSPGHKKERALLRFNTTDRQAPIPTPTAQGMATPLVLYASQTGTAADIAEHIHRELRRRSVAARLAAMDDYNIVYVRVTCGHHVFHTKKERYSAHWK